MPELRHRLGLDPEPGQVMFPHLAPPDNHLEGHQAIQALLPGLVDDAHPPLAQLPQDFVAWNPGPAGLRRIRPGAGIGDGRRKTAQRRRPVVVLAESLFGDRQVAVELTRHFEVGCRAG